MGTYRWKFDTILKMDLLTWTALVLAVFTFATPALSSEPRVVCYYTNWSVYRPGTAKFNPQNINPYLCTHLVYAFGGFTTENALKPFDKYQDIEKGGYAKFNGLKTYNKNLKTLLAIGGWNEGSSRFSPMVASKERRKEFVRNAIKFLRQNHFDGLDLDWEYPASRDGSKPKDRENYAKLVKELREEFEKESQKTGKSRLLLTMAVPAGISYIKKGFDVKTLNKYLDWMNLLTYDYHSAFEPAVNHHAPLYPLEEPNEYSDDSELTIDYTIKYYLENGADAHKLVLGIPTYGRSYTLFNPDAFEIGAPADGPGEQGEATREKGYLAYYEICEYLKPKERKRSVANEEEESEEDSEEEEEEEEWTVMYPNPKAMGPVAYRGNQWVGYDDIEIVKRKAEYVAENGLGGIMFWSIDNDDFRGTCHGKPYPLIEAAKEAYILKTGATDNAIVTEKPQPSRTSSRRRNRPRTSTTTTTTTLKPTAAKTLSSKRKSSVTSTTPSWNIITPEPPTTPDPGSDFKCKDEGFFPHPRDCKKYFWCLDSGPSNLGIVAHQFTCPSGLFFNKAADSCDFARNVLCKKPSATTKAPPKAPSSSTTTTTTTTTRRPIKLSTKNSVLFRTTTTTTTTPEPEVEEEDEVHDDAADIEAEDPKVIKELIDLIKKVGGVEQLEKHLKLSGGSQPADGATTTPSSLNKKLYKVLERTRGKSRFGNSILEEASSGNSRRGPQNAGLAPADDRDALLKKDRPQYTTINRSRQQTTAQPEEQEDESEQEAEVDSRPVSRARVAEQDGTTSKTLQYVNIRRARPTYNTDTADDTASRNALFERAEPYVAGALDVSARRENMPEYVTIRRQRPTTEETTTVQYHNTDLEEDSQGTALEREISAQPQYTSIVRARSTTLSPSEGLVNPEPTTVLAVQISSLLNSPSPTEAQTLENETEALITETEPTSTTTTTSTSTTTTTELPTAASSVTPRQIGFRRRGSTTTTPYTTTQVSTRSYSLISRRRPLSKPNEIVSDADELERSRKIRSTTPNSREITSDQGTDKVRQFRRQRVRVRPAQSDDSEPAAASQVPRGQFRPQISPDEVLSLTPIDLDTPQFVQRQSFNPRNDRRFRSRTTIAADKVEDSDVSAATVDVRRPSFPSRGRSRFSPSSTTALNEAELVTTETPNVQRQPAVARFSPRPFARKLPSSSTTTEPEEPEISEEKNVGTQRIPPRLPFGINRATSSPLVQARKLPFISRSHTTTELPVSKAIDDEDLENKHDISLSESAIEEQAHEDDNETTQEPIKRRRIIKKIRAPSQQDGSTAESPVVTEMLPIEESGKRKFKVIRRRPTSTTEAGDSSHNVLLTSTTVAPRKRIIIRKKIRPTENEPEIVAKSVGFVKAAQKDITTEAIVNYGEKTRPTILVSSVTQSSHDEEDNEDDIVPEILRVETDNDSDSNKENSDEEPVNKNIVKESESHSGNREEEVKSDSSSKETQPATVSNTESQREITKEEDTTEIKEHTDSETDRKPEVIIEDEQKSVVISETETTPTLPTSVTEESQPETTTSTTTPAPPSSSRTRLPYRPSRKLFTSSTEPPVPSSSRTFSRKYNPGAYTSPATIERESFRPSTTRRPLFTPRTTSRTRRPYTTARTTPKVEDEEEEYPDEEVLDEEPENSLVFVPAGQLFSRNPSQKEEESEEEYNSEEEETKEESLSNRFTSTSIKPGFKPRVVNSNTFRSSSTTEPTKKSVNSSQNRTAVYTRFGPNKPVDTTKRVQNVPVGYNSPVSTTSKTKLSVETKQTSTTAKEELSTTVSNVGTEITTVDDDYLSITEPSNLTTENANDATATNSVENETTTNFATNADTDDYLEFTTYYPTTQVGSTNTESESDNQIIYARGPVNTEANIEITTEILTDTTTTTTTQTPPVIKTQFDKLFSVSRSVEVNSKLDKHRLNKNNETTLIEEGKIMVEKKPVVNKIGEVSRFSFIKIVEDEIPIYLTKLGHIYPVEHLPDNNIRIDEARNARALQNFADAPRENLLASESINEAYRHIKKPNENSEIKDRIEHVPGDDFLSYVNDDKKTDKLEDAPFPSEWQFVPAAFEKENSDNKGAKNFEIITPHTLLTNPSTLPLESLFKTENPIMEQISDEKQNQPFVVYSSSLPNQKEEGNIVKLQVIKPETGRSIITFAKGQEFAGAPVNEDTTVKYPVSISVLPKSSDAISSTVNIVSTTTTERATSPVIQLLTTAQTTTLSTEPPTTITTEPTTTETVPEETTTLKLSPLDAKRSKIFPRRPIIKPFNATRPIPRANNKINATVSPNLSQKANKTTGFSPSKSRFNGNRAQNVPVDSRIKAVTKTTVKPRTFTTETSRSTTERRLFIKPIRPGFRPSFVPRKSITTTPASDT